MTFLRLKKILVSLLLTLIVSSFVFVFSAKPTQAQIFDIDLDGFVIEYVLMPIMKTESQVLAVMGKFMDGLMQPESILSKPIVEQGWKTTRDFANMFFILILLAIALSFILFPRFQVKNALPKLLLVALLMNFSLPIAGLFIDTANVFTSYFMKNISSDEGPLNLSEVIAASVNITNIYTLEPNFFQTPQGEDALQDFVIRSMISGIFFQAMLIFIFGAIAIMLFVRNIYLYFLLVLLPLALVAYIVDEGKFRSWSSNFVKWTFFAPVAAFFMYLSIIMFQSVNQRQAFDLASLNLDVGIMSYALDYFVIFGFLMGSLIAANYIGIEMGGSSIKIMKDLKNRAIGGVKRSGRSMGRLGLYGAQRAGLGKAIEGANDALSAVGRNKVGRVATLGLSGVLAGGASRGLRRLQTKTSQFVESRGSLSESEKKAWNAMSDENKLKYYKDVKADNAHKASVLASELAKSGLLKGKDDAESLALKQEAYKQAKRVKDDDAMSAIEKSDFRIFEQRIQDEYKNVMDGMKHPKTGKIKEDVRAKYYSSFKPSDIKDISRDMLDHNNGEFIRSMIKAGNLNAEHFKAALRDGNTELIKAFERARRGNDGGEAVSNADLKRDNKRLYDWLHSNAAQGLVDTSLNDIHVQNQNLTEGRFRRNPGGRNSPIQ